MTIYTWIPGGPGSIDDEAIALDKTWSSSKINEELLEKAIKSETWVEWELTEFDFFGNVVWSWKNINDFSPVDHEHPAWNIPVNVINFGKNLGPNDTNVQKALETIDDLDLWSWAGDVVWPAISVDENISVFDWTTWKLIKDWGKTIAEVLDRTNHTWEQAISTITGLQDELDLKAVALPISKISASVSPATPNTTYLVDASGWTVTVELPDVTSWDTWEYKIVLSSDTYSTIITTVWGTQLIWGFTKIINHTLTWTLHVKANWVDWYDVIADTREYYRIIKKSWNITVDLSVSWYESWSLYHSTPWTWNTLTYIIPDSNPDCLWFRAKWVSHWEGTTIIKTLSWEAIWPGSEVVISIPETTVELTCIGDHYAITQDSRPKISNTSLPFYWLDELSTIVDPQWGFYRQSSNSIEDIRFDKTTPAIQLSPTITWTDIYWGWIISDLWVPQGLVPEWPIVTSAFVKKDSWNANFNFYLEYYLYESNWTETLLTTSGLSQTISSWVYAEYSVSATMPATDFWIDWRLLRKVYFNKIGTATSPVASFQAEWPNPSVSIISVTAWNISHNILAWLELANTWITYGHINDQAQSIYWHKTFVDQATYSDIVNFNSLVNMNANATVDWTLSVDWAQTNRNTFNVTNPTISQFFTIDWTWSNVTIKNQIWGHVSLETTDVNRRFLYNNNTPTQAQEIVNKTYADTKADKSSINTETLTWDKTLTVWTDDNTQLLDPDWTSRSITLSTTWAVEWDYFKIQNTALINTTRSLRIYQSTTYKWTIVPWATAIFTFDWTNWINTDWDYQILSWALNPSFINAFDWVFHQDWEFPMLWFSSDRVVSWEGWYIQLWGWTTTEAYIEAEWTWTNVGIDLRTKWSWEVTINWSPIWWGWWAWEVLADYTLTSTQTLFSVPITAKNKLKIYLEPKTVNSVLPRLQFNWDTWNNYSSSNTASDGSATSNQINVNNLPLSKLSVVAPWLSSYFIIEISNRVWENKFIRTNWLKDYLWQNMWWKWNNSAQITSLDFTSTSWVSKFISWTKVLVLWTD